MYHLDRIVFFSGEDVVLCLSEKMEDKSLETLIKLALDTRFPNEFAAWQRRRKEIMQGFRGTLVDRQAAMHATIDQNLEDMRAKIQAAVIPEVLKAFP
jgi:hypothetical protein